MIPTEDHGGVPEFSLAGIERRLDELRLTEDVTKLRREVHALLEVVKAADAVRESWREYDRIRQAFGA